MICTLMFFHFPNWSLHLYFIFVHHLHLKPRHRQVSENFKVCISFKIYVDLTRYSKMIPVKLNQKKHFFGFAMNFILTFEIQFGLETEN